MVQKINKGKIINEWIKKHGAADVDLKNRDIILYDGGLFSIESKKVKRSKVIDKKKLPDGMYKLLFSKKKYTDVDYYANLWIEELDETIDYLRSMRKMLRGLGYDTGKSIKWQKGLLKNNRKKILKNKGGKS